jgi:hypothetical protein
LRDGASIGIVAVVSEALIEREEIVALLFNVSDVAESLRNIELLLGGNDAEEEEAD